MLAILFVATLSVVSPTDAPPVAPAAKEPTKFCREMNNASSRLYSVKVCKTRAQWRRWENCHSSVTRYCTPASRKLAASALGRQTAFPLNENSRIICRWLSVTGTRIKQVETCLPKREWDRMWVENSEGLLKRQGEHSTLARGVQ
jgi:hypothetical protein